MSGAEGGGDRTRERFRSWQRRAAYAGAALLLLGALGVLDPVTVVGLFVLALAALTLQSSVEIVQAYERRALTVFGEYRDTLGPGLAFVPPFVSETHIFDMRTQTMDVPSQEAITRDNSPVTADAVVYVRVMDAKKAFLEVDDYKRATSLLAQTSLRAVLGDMDLDETLSRRDRINERIREELDAPTDEWGVRVESVEVREVTPSPGVKNAMERQTSAERKRRAMILEAQGERQSAIERATGNRDAAVIRAQGEKQSQVLSAQGDAVATVLRARAADAMGERAVVDKGLETLASIGQSPSTTYVLPQELTSLLGRYGRRLTGGVGGGGPSLTGRRFDEETRDLLGLDDVEGMAAGDGEAADIRVETPDGEE